MKKELIISIIIGFGLGLLITFGVYKARMAVKEQAKIVSPLAEEEQQSPAKQENVFQNLSLVSPIDQSILKEPKVVISGVTSPSSWITILAEKGEKVIQADKKGNFETEIGLISGENEIEIHSVSETGEEVIKIITVVYTTTEI